MGGVDAADGSALVMTHSDDAGLVLPPKLAPIEVVLVPIYKGEEQMAEIVGALQGVADELKAAGTAREGRRRRFEAVGVEVRGARVEGRARCGWPWGLATSLAARSKWPGSDTRTKEIRGASWLALLGHVKGLLDEIQQSSLL